MKRLSSTLLALAATAVVAGTAEAQLPNLTPFSFEVSGGLAFPTGTLEDKQAEAGYTVGGSVTYHLMPMLGIYAGYDRAEFGVDGFDDASYTDQGFSAGVRAAIPTPLIPLDPWVKAGAIFHRFGSEGFAAGEDENFESDYALGYEVGAGLGFSFTNKLMLAPAVIYRSYSYEDTPGDEVEINYLAGVVAVRVRL